jgi:hypothetical protein
MTRKTVKAFVRLATAPGRMNRAACLTGGSAEDLNDSLVFRLHLGRRMHVEEKALAQALGDPYRSYMMQTKHLIPTID